MGYYQAGDYRTYGYGGDPGFLSSVWKGIKTVGKIALGIPIKPAAAAPPIMRPPPRLPPPPPTFPPPRGRGGGFFPGVGTGIAAGAVVPAPRPGPAQVIPQAGCCPPGYHISKTTGACVRNRRMNPCNPKALRRAIRRVDGFGRLAKRMGYVKRSTTRRRSPCK